MDVQSRHNVVRRVRAVLRMPCPAPPDGHAPVRHMGDLEPIERCVLSMRDLCLRESMRSGSRSGSGSGLGDACDSSLLDRDTRTALSHLPVHQLLHETRSPHTRSESRAPSYSTHAWQVGCRVPTYRCARSALPSPRGHRSGIHGLWLRARRPSARWRLPSPGAERCIRQRRRCAAPRGGSSR